MKKRIIWIVAIVLVVVVGFVGYRWYSRRSARLAAAVDLRSSIATAKVERRDLEVDVTGKGTVQANQKRNVQPGVAGTVTQVLVNEGDLVTSGTPILVLTNDSVQYQADQAALDLALAKQTLDSLTGPAGSKAKAELDLKQAELNLSNAQEKVDALGVRSPLSGEVFTVEVKVGDSVKSGQTIVTVADTNSFTVSFMIAQADLHKYTVGDQISIGSVNSEDYAWRPGILTSIGREGTAGSAGVEFPATVAVSDPDPDLRAGLAVMVYYRYNGKIITTRGTVNAQDKRDVKAEVDGTAIAVPVAEGSKVENGQVLVQMENDSQVFALEQARNAVIGAQQDLTTYQDSISSQQLKVEQAQVTADDKAKSAAKLVVTSPINGKITSRAASVGDEVGASQTVAVVAEVSPLTVVIPVDELDISNVAIGQPARIEVDALPGKTFDGVVSEIAQEGTVQQGITNYNVTVEMQSNEPRLGMSATATIAVAKKTQVLSVPVEAVKWDQGQAYVNQMQDGQVTQKRVKIGVQSDLYAEVVSGLNEGEIVLVGNLPETGMGMGMFRMPAQGRVFVPGGQGDGEKRIQTGPGK